MAIDTFISRVATAIVNPIIYLLFSLAFLVFLWGVFQFVWNSDDATTKEEGKRHLLWGVVGMAIIVAASGILAIIQATANSL